MNEEENSTEVFFFSLDGGREWWVLVDGVLGGGFTSFFLFCIQNEGKERFIQPGICAQRGQSQCFQSRDKQRYARCNLSISMVISHSVEEHVSFRYHT